MGKDTKKKIKELVDISIEFLKIISNYLGKAVASILPLHKKQR